jgi:hypothetical protein
MSVGEVQTELDDTEEVQAVTGDDSTVAAGGEPAAGTEATPDGADDAGETPPPSPEDSGETPSEPAASSVPEWVNDDFRELAASYDMSDDELAAFGSPMAFQVACRAIDKRLVGLFAAEAKKPAEVKKPASPPAETPAPRPAKTPPPDENDEDLTLDLARFEGYDEETLRVVRVAKRLQEQNRALTENSTKFQETLDRIQEERATERAEAEVGMFHDIVDGMDKELFGGNGPLTPELDERRKTLLDAYIAVKHSVARTAKPNGRPPKPPSIRTVEMLVKRAAFMAFGDEIFGRERKKMAQDVLEQSKRRRPAPGKAKVLPGAAAAKSEPKTLHEAAQEIASDPEVAALFDKHLEASGTAPQ